MTGLAEAGAASIVRGWMLPVHTRNLPLPGIREPMGSHSSDRSRTRGKTRMSLIHDAPRGMRNRTRRLRSRFCAIAAGLFVTAALTAASPSFAGDLDKVVVFDIKAQPLEKALVQFGVQAHVQIMFASKSRLDQVWATALNGKNTDRQALTDLLRGSQFYFVDDGKTAEVVPKSSVPSGHDRQYAEQTGSIKSNATSARGNLDSETSAGRPKKKSATVTGEAAVLQQVIVTGTHLSGGPPPSSPIISITRRQIRQSGYQTVEQLMDSLPENFAAVGSEASGIALSSELNAGNIANGAAVDLMGLGADSTLVLVNGHRLAPSGTSGAFTDVSVIPLSAIKRIDIMTDGASAIYGADAIGGVVNYVLRSHEQGAETSVEYGSVTSGGLKRYRASQSAGLNWSSGSAFLAYEFQKQQPLLATDRSFSRSVGPWDLLAGLAQNSLYATGTDLVGRAKMESDAFLSTRTGSYSSGSIGVPLPFKVRTRSTQYSIGVGSSMSMSPSWTGKIRVSYGGNHTRLEDRYGTTSARSSLLTLGGAVSGSVIKLRTGDIKAAFGGQVRRERFARHFSGAFTVLGAITRNRTVGSLFVETSIPLTPPGSRLFGKPALAIDLAARYEHYSDFGSSFNPRAGISWNPVRALRIRATVSTSFKPPNFYELYGSQQAYLENALDARSASGVAPIVELDGSNPSLRAERSAEWTAGMDFRPESIQGLNVHATYFHIRFRNRIASPNVPYLNVFGLGSSYAPFIQEGPSVAELNGLTQPPTQYFDYTTYPGYGPPATLSSAMAILNNRLQNIGLTRVSGVDDTVNYTANLHGFSYHGGVNTAYLFRYQNVAIAGVAPIEVLSTLEHPVNFRGRVTAGFDRKGWSVNGALNFVNHYSDLSGPIPVRIASWTTVDMQVAYRFPRDGHLPLNRLQLALSCTNCLDRPPPTVRTTSYLFGYDPTNASPMGRFVSFTVRKRW